MTEVGRRLDRRRLGGSVKALVHHAESLDAVVHASLAAVNSMPDLSARRHTGGGCYLDRFPRARSVTATATVICVNLESTTG